MNGLNHKSNSGFTLVEIIVVLVILAILAVIAVPTMMGFINSTKQQVCEIKRADIVRMYPSMRQINHSLTLQKFVEDNWGSEQLCPEGGIYYYQYNYEEYGTDVIHIVCTVHSDGYEKLWVQSKQLSDLLSGMTQAEQREYLGAKNNGNNEKIAYMLKQLGGTWEQLSNDVLNQTTYLKNESTVQLYVRPMFCPEDGTVILYANPASTNDETNLWATNLIFNPENGKWYEYTKKHPYQDKRVTFNLSNYGYRGKTWAQLKEELSNTELWKEVPTP